MKWNAACLLITFVCGIAASEPASHCTKSEKIYFSCVTQSKDRVLSVCGSSNLSAPDAYLQYRFGATNKVELEYPVNRLSSIQAFRFSHYVRPRVSYVSLTFTSGIYEYTVFNDYAGDSEPEQKSSGVTITKTDASPIAEILCKDEVLNRLIDLEEIVPRAADNESNN